MRFFFFLIPIIFVFQACTCEKKVIKKEKLISNVNTISKLKYKENYKSIFNKSKTFALVYKRYKKQTQSIPDLMYFVYSLNKNNIVLEDTLSAGDVYWFNDFSIRAIEREQKAESARRMYTYDVIRQQYILD